jgi:hypothetical protein
MANMTQTAQEVRTVTIAGRDIAVTKIGETQAVLIGREGILLQKPGLTFDRLSAGMNRILGSLESLIVKDEDREWITDQMFAGTVELSDLLEIVKAFKDDGDAAPVKPVVRRGRPPKNRG